MRSTFLAIALCAVTALSATAQETTNVEKYAELLRSDWKADRVAIITEALDLTDEQSTKFWPIYREYDGELTLLNDQRWALIKDFAGQYTTMTDEGAKDLMKQAFKLRNKRNDLLEKYAGKVTKEIGGRAAARWAQLESALHSMLDLGLASELPLIR